MVTLASVLVPAGGAGVTVTGALILVACAWIVFQGLRMGHDYTLGALLRSLADSTRGIRWVGGKIAATFEAIDSLILRAIGLGIDATEYAAARLWDALAWSARQVADSLVWYANHLHDTIRSLVVSVIPGQIRDAVTPLWRGLDRLDAATRARDRAETVARSRGIDRLLRDFAAERLARIRGIDDVRGLIRSHVIPRVRGLERDLADLRGYTRRTLARRVSRLEAALAGGAVAAVALGVVVRRFPWLRCSNVNRFARMLCRSPIGALDFLFALAALVVVALDPVRMLHLAEDASDELGGVIRTMAGLPRS